MIVCGNLGKAYSSYSDWTLHDGPSCRSNVEKPSNEEKKINWRKQEPSAHATLATLSLSRHDSEIALRRRIYHAVAFNVRLID